MLIKPTSFSSLGNSTIGREEEMSQLAEALRLSLEGTRLVLISGDPGMGKTTLAKTLHPFVEVEEGFFIAGKFTPEQKETPYAAPLMALNSLMEAINKLDENRKSVYRKKIEETLGERLTFLYNALPLLKTLMGASGNFEYTHLELSQEEASQFLEGIELLFTLFAHGKAPFVFLIDNIQWADKASVHLLKNLLSPQAKSRMLIVLTFETKSLDPESFLYNATHGLSETPTLSLELGPLNEDAAKSLTPEMPSTLLKKALRNPFYLEQLKVLLKENGLKNLESKSLDTIDKILDLRMEALSFRTQEILKLISATGSYFDEQRIRKISPYTLDEIEEAFSELAQRGFIERAPLPGRELPLLTTWSFTHNLFQKAAARLLEPEIKALCHLEIARALIKGTSNQELQENAYLISYQINHAVALVKTEEDRKLGYKANALSAEKALKAGSYSISESYIKSALSFLPENKWQNAYQESAHLFLLLGETAYLQGRFQEAETHLTLLLEMTRTPEEKLDVLALLIRQSISIAEYARAIKYGNQALGILGIPLSKWGYRASLIKEYFQCRLNTLRDPLERLSKLPAMKDEKALKQVKIIASMIPAIYLKERDKLPYYVFKAFNLIIKHGMHPLGPTVLTTWAVVFNRLKKNIPLLLSMGDFALKLSGALPYRKNLPAVLFLYGQFIAPFRHSIKESRSYFERGFADGVSQGDLIYALFSLNQGAIVDFILENNLDVLEAKLLSKLNFLEKYKEPSRAQILIALIQTVRALKGETVGPTSFEGKDFLEAHFFRKLKESSFNTSLFTALTLKMILAYLFDNAEEALDISRKAKPYSIYLSEHLTYAEYLFFLTLSLIQLYPKKDPSTKRAFKKEIFENLSVLRGLNKDTQGRFHGTYLLVEAEASALFNGKLTAMEYYEKALSLAKEAGVPKVEALIYERYAAFLKNEGFQEAALRFLEIAIELYDKWGAHRKAEELTRRAASWRKAE